MNQIPTLSSIKNLFILAISLLIFWSCKKDNPVEPPLIDPKLVGVWYNGVDTVGFEILADGTMKNLQVDTEGRLEYAPPQDTVTGALTFKIESARGSAISLRGTYKSHTIDSTYVTTGIYTFSNNDNTLTLTLIVPLNGASEVTFVYKRSFVGEVVVPGRGKR